MASSREKILQRLKAASERRQAVGPEMPDFATSVYTQTEVTLKERFRKNTELVSGIFYEVANLNEAVDTIKKLTEEKSGEGIFCLDKKLRQAMVGKITCGASPAEFADLRIGITPCEFLVADFGSVVVSSGGDSGRRLHVFPETHIVIAHSGQLAGSLEEALSLIGKKYKDNMPSMITNITGPSRTADIEKTLVKGMHGPEKLIVILCEEPF